MTSPYQNSVLMNFGRSVSRRRKDLGLSQEALAHLAGLHRTYIGDIERGGRNVSFVNLVRLISALDTTPDELLRDALAEYRRRQ